MIEISLELIYGESTSEVCHTPGDFTYGVLQDSCIVYTPCSPSHLFIGATGYTVSNEERQVAVLFVRHNARCYATEEVV